MEIRNIRDGRNQSFNYEYKNAMGEWSKGNCPFLAKVHYLNGEITWSELRQELWETEKCIVCERTGCICTVLQL